MFDKPIFVQGDQMEVADDTATLSNPDLASAVKDHPDEAASFLSDQVSPVDLSEISLDDVGRVVIKDAAFATIIAARRREPAQEGIEAAIKNGVCGGGC